MYALGDNVETNFFVQGNVQLFSTSQSIYECVPFDRHTTGFFLSVKVMKQPPSSFSQPAFKTISRYAKWEILAISETLNLSPQASFIFSYGAMETFWLLHRMDIALYSRLLLLLSAISNFFFLKELNINPRILEAVSSL